MKSQIKYQGGLHFIGQTESGHEIQWDSAPVGVATNGSTPMEAVLQAAAVCSAMDVVSILKKRRKEISTFELEVEADRKSDHPKIFENLTITYRIAGNGITLEEVEKAVSLSHDKYCTVANMLKPKVNVGYRVELLEDQSS